jgi:prevent-host-death family protein
MDKDTTVEIDKTIEAEELQKDLARVLEEITTTHAPYIITRNGRPAVVMLAYEDYVKLLSREEILAQFNQTWAEIGERNLQYSEEEVEADLEQATRELRERRRGAA